MEDGVKRLLIFFLMPFEKLTPIPYSLYIIAIMYSNCYPNSFKKRNMHMFTILDTCSFYVICVHE
jgi:hypothetical protein